MSDGGGAQGTSTKFCHVCDEAIEKFKGLHYGGQTCYSCRAFFRRCHSADRKHPFEASCKNDGRCEVSVKSRRKCPKCRHVKCLRIGMRPDLVLTSEEKQARFRKYYEKKKASQMNNNADSNGNVGSGSGRCAPTSPTVTATGKSGMNAHRPARQQRCPFPPQNQSSRHLLHRSSEGDSNSACTDTSSLDGFTNSANDSSIMEGIVESPLSPDAIKAEPHPAGDTDHLLNDTNLLQLCMEEVDKILRSSSVNVTPEPNVGTFGHSSFPQTFSNPPTVFDSPASSMSGSSNYITLQSPSDHSLSWAGNNNNSGASISNNDSVHIPISTSDKYILERL